MVHEECLSGYLAREATCFPQMIGAASTWEPDIIEEMTLVVRQQMRAVGAHQGLSPVLDIARDPRWGRTEETFGEDPYLASRMGVSYIRGLQSADLKKGVVATCKHFVGYGLSAGGLNWAPALLPPRELHDIYLTPFEAAVREAKVASIMNAYNELDGIPCGCSRELLTEILRERWGFDGIVVSDYHTVVMLAQYHRIAGNRSEAAAMALEAGLDVELPATDCYAEPLREALQRGLVSESVIDTAVSRILKMKFQLGLFENPFVDAEEAAKVFDTPGQRGLARRIAQKSIVLLKNDNGLLPFKKNLRSIAVIGPNADDVRNMVGDYSHFAHIEIISEVEEGSDTDPSGHPPASEPVPIIGVLSGIRQCVSSGAAVHYAKGCDVSGDSKEGFAEAIGVARKADVAVLVLGGKSGLTPSCTSGEFRDRADICLPGVQEDLARAVVETGTPVVAVLINGRPLSIPWIAEHVPAIVEAWLPGEEGGTAVAEVLFGDYNPGGKLPVSIPRAVGQIPAHYNHKPSGRRSVIYGDYVDLSCSPLFAFGHGLSYTRFEYDNLRIEPVQAGSGETVRMCVDVANAGDRQGDEVVQLYVHDAMARITRPVMELKGFKRLTLDPKEKCTVAFDLHVNQLGFSDADMQFVVEPGAIEVMIGGASDDIRVTGEFEIIGEKTEISATKLIFSTATVI
jgi:beta-glucosidase